MNAGTDYANFVVKSGTVYKGAGVTGSGASDGMYTLRATSAGIHDPSGVSLTTDYSQRFHRLFGDSDGDRDVDQADLLLFRKAFNRSAEYVDYFDYDGDNDVDVTDYQQFKLRLTGRRLY